MATPNKPPVEEVTPHVSMAHSSEPVLRWEENKRWQRRVDGLRVKLADKTKAAESAVRQVTSLKETLARADREKNLLQGKIKSLQKSLSDMEKSKDIKKEMHPQTHVAGFGSHGDNGRHGDGTGEQYVLKKRVFDLEEEVARLKRELSIDRDGEFRESEMKNQQLVKSVETLQRQLRQQVYDQGFIQQGGAGISLPTLPPSPPFPLLPSPSPSFPLLPPPFLPFSCPPFPPHPPSPLPLPTQSSESCPSVGERESELERELLETKKENMELRFDYEQAIVELPRLRVSKVVSVEYGLERCEEKTSVIQTPLERRKRPV